MFNKMILGLAVCLFLTYGTAQDLKENPSTIRFGADERIRQEYFDKIPAKFDPPGYARGGENNYFRYRTRIWSEWDPAEQWTLRVRLTNEIRTWMEPDMSSRPERSTYEYPDEVVFDNLYLERRNLLDGALDLRVGRQDLTYGNKKVIFDGTPGDGSRTIYFNAVKAAWRINPQNTLDWFAISNKSDDDLAMNTTERDLNSYSRSIEDVTESGTGLYWKNSTLEKYPFEVYLIYKKESEYAERTSTGISSYSWQELDASGTLLSNPQLDLYTIGTRWMSAWSPSVGGNLELAFQCGERGDEEVQGWMVDVSIRNSFFLDSRYKPSLEYGIYTLSGDKSDSDKDESWNPLWARAPQISELYVFSYDSEQSAARWSNLLAPHMDLVASNLLFNAKTTLAFYYLRALEDDGAGDGKNRGMLYVFKNEFTLAEKKLTNQDKLSGVVWIEALDPGNYHSREDAAVFVRGELMYSF